MGKTKDLAGRMDAIEELLEKQGQLLASLANRVGKVQVEASPVSKIMFCRYIRPVTMFGDVSNLNAVTLAIEFDFEARTIAFGWSICVNENFDRDVGRSMAEYRLANRPIVLPYPASGIKSGGVVGVLAKYMGVSNPKDFYSWREVLRKLK